MLGVVLIDYYNNNYSSSGFVQIIYLLHLVGSLLKGKWIFILKSSKASKTLFIKHVFTLYFLLFFALITSNLCYNLLSDEIFSSYSQSVRGTAVKPRTSNFLLEEFSYLHSAENDNIEDWWELCNFWLEKCFNIFPKIK